LMVELPRLAGVDPRELGRLRWRCRRGMKELDELLTRYVNERFCGASNLEQDLFKELLETQDPVLYAYCLGSQPPPPQFVALIERITAHSSGLDSAPARGC
jgi:antitoxin CptB